MGERKKKAKEHRFSIGEVEADTALRCRGERLLNEDWQEFSDTEAEEFFCSLLPGKRFRATLVLEELP